MPDTPWWTFVALPEHADEVSIYTAGDRQVAGPFVTAADADVIVRAVNTLDEAKRLLMLAYRDQDEWRTNGWFMAVERLYPEEFGGV